LISKSATSVKVIKDIEPSINKDSKRTGSTTTLLEQNAMKKVG